jgi:hypothetical protein
VVNVYVLFACAHFDRAGLRAHDALWTGGVVATEEEAEAWRLAVTHGKRWWEMYEVGQVDQGRLDSSPEAVA